MRTAQIQTIESARRGSRGRCRPGPGAQRGVVLIIALVMLVVISLLTTLSIRSAVSTESVSGNVRTTELATQAAEIALRYCESKTVQIKAGTVTPPAPDLPDILPYQPTPRWLSAANWDVNPSDAFVIPATAVNAGAGPVTYRRPPECMVEEMQVVTPAGLLTTSTTYVITARGFGPEVAAANAARSRPQGSEVWMQSTIELE